MSEEPSKDVEALVGRAAEIIELGDQRLMAGDGPCGGLPPDITLDEWRELYVCLEKARTALRSRASKGEVVAYLVRDKILQNEWTSSAKNIAAFVLDKPDRYEVIPLVRSRASKGEVRRLREPSDHKFLAPNPDYCAICGMDVEAHARLAEEDDHDTDHR